MSQWHLSANVQNFINSRQKTSWIWLFVLTGMCMYILLDLSRTAQRFFGPRHWTDPYYCETDCLTGGPCEYRDEVDFRLVSIAFDRYPSLEKHLNRILELDTLGDRVSIDIWIDRDDTNFTIHPETYLVAKNFTERFNALGKGRACVHNQTGHAYITGQWIDSWRPKQNTKEVALILEDDIDVSVHMWKWLKPLAARFLNQPNISGVTLQMENILYWDPDNRIQISAPKDDTIFLFPTLGVWGYAPNPDSWRDFQDWWHASKENKTNKPMIPMDIVPTRWYKQFGDSMWEMWHMYFSYIRREWSVYSNLYAFTGREDVLIGTNRQELGLHYKTPKNVRDDSFKLLKEWDEKYVKIPESPVYFWYDGNQIA